MSTGLYPTTETHAMGERVGASEQENKFTVQPPTQFELLYGAIIRQALGIRALKPSILATLVGVPTVTANSTQQYVFRINDKNVTVYAIQIVNSSAAIQYFNVEAPASAMTVPIAANSVYIYNLSAVRRFYIFSTAGVTVYPVEHQNVGGSETGLYVQGWTIPESKDYKGENA